MGSAGVLTPPSVGGIEVLPQGAGHVEYSAGWAWQAVRYSADGVALQACSFATHEQVRAWIDDLKKGRA